MARTKSDDTTTTSSKSSRKPKAEVVEEVDDEVVVEKKSRKPKAEKTVVESAPAEKPKKSRKPKAEVEEEAPAEEKPKKTRKPKAEKVEESSSSSEEKPKKTRKPKAEKATSESSDEKPKKTRKPKAEKAESVDEDGEKTKRVRKVVTLEDVESKFGDLQSLIESEMKSVKEGSTGSGLKFLRSLKSHVRELNVDCSKLAKTKVKKPKREGTSTGGFNKPLHISSELASFLGRKPNDLVSRNDVTRFVCDYIKKHNLQNPKDRREILGDDKLNKLLDHNPSEDTPLKYPTIQKKINRHYLSSVATVNESDSE